ncbi:MAG TPA: hypothetical protein VJ792_08620 [Candidatus Nitrosotalea sp.]|nr:hypothetical protein [Candidatus Nitrosotalea sp.]
MRAENQGCPKSGHSNAIAKAKQIQFKNIRVGMQNAKTMIQDQKGTASNPGPRASAKDGAQRLTLPPTSGKTPSQNSMRGKNISSKYA